MKPSLVVHAFAPLALVLGGCLMVPPAGAPAQSGAAPASSSGSEPATSKAETAEAAPAKPEADLTPPAGMPDLGALVGPRRDGWTPKVFTGLKAGMSPADAAKVLPGADKPNENGFAEIPVKNVPGVDMYELHFQEDDKTKALGLFNAKIVFAKSLNTDAFYEYLLKATTNKYGDADPKDVSEKLIVWMGDDFASATVQEVVDHYELTFKPASK